jgi:hypothetical protein
VREGAGAKGRGSGPRDRRDPRQHQVPILLGIVGFLGLLHAELEGEAGEGFTRGIVAKPRPLFFGDPAGSFHPWFARRDPLEVVAIFHEPIVAQGVKRPDPVRQEQSTLGPSRSAYPILGT